MLNVIAVGTDGSKTADRALEAAIDMAKRFDAQLVVLSAYQTRPSSVTASALAVGWMPATPMDVGWSEEASDRVQQILDRALEQARRRGVECSCQAADGDPAQMLVELAESHDADLLVIGNRGMQRRVLGSVPNTITHKARCSVLVVKTSG
jgi:nucleotide-binding universal stress UspA family protein